MWQVVNGLVGGGQEIEGLYSVGGRPKDEGEQSEPAPTRVALRMDGTWTGNTLLVCSCQIANQGG
jgi:hypothetical protein